MKGDKVTWIKIYDEKIEKESTRMIGDYYNNARRSVPKNTL